MRLSDSQPGSVRRMALPPDNTWTHAMKMHGNGTWSSKNGGGPLFVNVMDPMAFGNAGYPPPTGESNAFTTYYE